MSVVEATYDDDTRDQYVAIKVDNKETKVQDLITAGYSVEFTAFARKSGTELSSVFEDVTTGKLASDLDTALATELGIVALPASGQDIYVQVKLIKDTETITSEVQKITIKNIDLATDAITAQELETSAGVVLNSSTFVVGETVTLNKITVRTDNNEEDVPSGFRLSSSNTSVVSVDGTDLIANTPGTSNITISYGGVTKVLNITVKNEAREVNRVNVVDMNKKSVSSATALKGGTSTIRVFAYDQYGDPIAETIDVVSSNTSVGDFGGNARDSIVTTTDGEFAVATLDAKASGSTTITFRNSEDAKLVSNAYRVQVTDNTAVSTHKLDLVEIKDSNVATYTGAYAGSLAKEDFSKDTTVDILDDQHIVLELNGYTSANVKAGTIDIDTTYDHDSDPLTPDIDRYEVTVLQSKAGVLDGTPYEVVNNRLVLKAGTQAGTATISVKDLSTGKTIVSGTKITVVKVGYNVKSVALKTIATPSYPSTYDYRNVLNVNKVDVNKDPIVSGVTLTTSSSQPVRIDIQSGVNGNGRYDLYLDRNANGINDGNDVIVGEFDVVVAGTFANTFNLADFMTEGTGYNTTTGDDGTLIFRVLDRSQHVVSSSSVKVEL